MLRSLPALDGLKLGGDQQIGVNIIKRAIEEPIRQIANNAGHEGSVVVQKVKTLPYPKKAALLSAFWKAVANRRTRDATAETGETQ